MKILDLPFLILSLLHFVRENPSQPFNRLPFPCAHLCWVELPLGRNLLNRLIELRPVFRTVCLLTLRGHFPSHIFESLFWRFVADA